MRKMNLKVLSIGVVLFTLWSCSGNNDAQQQAAMPPVQEQQMQTPPVDTAQAQAANQAQAQAATAANAQSLPAPITDFIKKQFPNATIAGIEADHEHGGLEYDVYLSDGTQIDFDANNQWEKVESMKGVPAFFIPKAIASHVKGSYQNAVITKINKEYNGYEVELNNGVELRFDGSGRFMGMDD